MTDPEIRRLRDDELVGFVETAGTAFLERPKDVAKVADELRSLWDLERTWGAFDGARMCGTFRSWATELTLPGGGRLPASAVSGGDRPAHPPTARDPARHGGRRARRCP